MGWKASSPLGGMEVRGAENLFGGLRMDIFYIEDEERIVEVWDVRSRKMIGIRKV